MITRDYFCSRAMRDGPMSLRKYILSKNSFINNVVMHLLALLLTVIAKDETAQSNTGRVCHNVTVSFIAVPAERTFLMGG